MLKKEITFKDLDGNEVTEEFYFNLSEAEIAEMELSFQGGLSDHLKKIIESSNGAAIMNSFKEIIKKSVGRRSEDGRRLMKSEEITNDFLYTDAYSTLFMELVTDAQASTEFIKAIVPASLKDRLDKVQDNELPYDEAEQPAWIRENREPTQQELSDMSPEQLREAFKRKNTTQLMRESLQTRDESQSSQ